MIRPVIHMILHFVVPGIIAKFGFKKQRLRAWAIMVFTIIIDLDHFFASPIYDPNRCGIGFHPLHSYPAIAGYFLLAAMPRTRIVGTGLLIHIILDWIDCIWIGLECQC